jgi:hypothetical protein
MPIEVDLDINGAIDIQFGGTNANDEAGARFNLGVGNVNNTSDADKPISTATQSANVDNTSDADKPISTAAQSALDTKSPDFNVNDMFGLISISTQDDGDVANIAGYFATFPQSEFDGGGAFVWQASLNKNLANGGTIIDPDNTGGFDGTASTRNAFLAAQGSGAGVGCWVRSTTGIINVYSFGAVGDGVVDDTAAIQATIDSLDALGGTVLVSGGVYNISSTINMGNGDGSTNPSTKNGVKLIGAGAGFAVSGALVPTIFNWVGSNTTSPMLAILGQISDVELNGILFSCNGNCGGFYGTSFSGSTFKNLKIVNPNTSANGITILGGGTPTGNYNIFNVFENISIGLLSPNSVGLFMDGDYSVQNDTWISQFRNMRIENVAGATNSTCAWFKFVDSISFYRCHFDNKPEPTSNCIIFDALANHQFPAGMAFYDCSVNDTAVSEDGSHFIRKNYFYGFGTFDLETIPTHDNLVGITDDGVVFGDFLYNSAWQTFVPVITAQSGTITTSSATGRYRQDGKKVYIQIAVTITTNGTGAGDIRATLPSGPGNVTGDDYFGIGRDTILGGVLVGQFGVGSQVCFIKKYDDTYPGADTAVLELSGFYEVA